MSSGNIDSLIRLVDGPWSSIGTVVSMVWPMLTLGCSRRNVKTARVSGSDRGYSPAPLWV